MSFIGWLFGRGVGLWIILERFGSDLMGGV